MSDSALDAVAKRWAAKEYDLPKIEQVHFSDSSEHGCETCGYGGYMISVLVVYDGGKTKEYEVEYATQLLRDLVGMS